EAGAGRCPGGDADPPLAAPPRDAPGRGCLRDVPRPPGPARPGGVIPPGLGGDAVPAHEGGGAREDAAGADHLPGGADPVAAAVLRPLLAAVEDVCGAELPVPPAAPVRAAQRGGLRLGAQPLWTGPLDDRLLQR